ncbi:Uncharacterised protein [Mycobacteroides abscessus subsp. bolletii]|uniref:hypothetical protein n=1 Tax=Mycobacteroides abscessus TaxID=36809 RepID=UPI000928C578|nr:hypothetical protein [Mycobacteroides abscessus]QSM03872.1 hypothetical protein PROPHIGD91-2_15 [Mycobacterium phage prophiGD91-2]QSM90494.1 hypothetical protein I3U44_07430 [Mycobacteroides abscessus subsp. bolletii]QSM90780.1 hypothetical protein I3U44_09075 [Mycobacteroides abscessus subsp. bolletii]SIJ02506.1 Uncharacterised protein [Mycobacteroides abscessus subsp. bolletii]SKU53672.1 Uncharacterised protein [Mycobacteroides abscessus subsp. bolletii]
MTVESAVERIVYDCAADIDLEEIEEMLASVRSQLPNPESVLWRYDKCELETYTALSAELGVNPRALNAEIQRACSCAQIGMEFKYSEDEEGEAA